MNHTHPPAIDHSLLFNGLDFIHSSVESIQSKDPDKAKYAILHLFAGALLVLKERIHSEHWSLLFQRPDDASLTKFRSGDFEGISYTRIIHTLREVCQVELQSDGLKALEELRKTRNKIEHFKFTLSLATIKPTVAKVLAFLVNFIEVEIVSESLEFREEDLFASIKQLSKEFREYLVERLAHVEKYANQKKCRLFHCPSCLEKALVQENDTNTCFVCDEKNADSESIAIAHIEHGLGDSSFLGSYDRSDLPLYQCPECEDETLVPENDLYVTFICVACSESVSGSRIQSCYRCGCGYVANSEEDLNICSNCFSNLHKD